MKKNVIIVILVILVLGMGGYLVYDKVIDKDVENKDKVIEQIEKYDLEEAKELVDKYYDFGCGDNMFNIGLTEDYKMYITYMDLNHFALQESDSKYLGAIDITGGDGTELETYIYYDNFVENYKKLFGEKSVIEKKEYLNSCPGFSYLKSENVGEIFIVRGACGCGAGRYSYYEVLDATKNNKKLMITVGTITLEADENLIYTLDGKTYQESIPENVLSNYIKNSNKVDKYELEFVKENGHYYLNKIEKK